MNWTVNGVPYPAEFFGSFAPMDILYDFDGPRIFTVLNRHGASLLVYQCDEDDTASRFVVVPCDPALVDALLAGRRSVRDALTHPWIWVVEQPHGQPIRDAWHGELTMVPEGLLPGESVMLLASMAAPSQTPTPSTSSARHPRAPRPSLPSFSARAHGIASRPAKAPLSTPPIIETLP